MPKGHFPPGRPPKQQHTLEVLELISHVEGQPKTKENAPVHGGHHGPRPAPRSSHEAYLENMTDMTNLTSSEREDKSRPLRTYRRYGHGPQRPRAATRL